MYFAQVQTRKSEYTVFGKSKTECKKLLKDYFRKEYYPGFFEEMHYDESLYCVKVKPGEVWWDMDHVVNK